MDRNTVDELLTTTRSVRLRLDLNRPVDPQVIEDCLELAVQAPQGSGNCRYHFVVVTDPVKRAGLADLNRRAFETFYPAESIAERTRADPRNIGSWLAHRDRFHEIPMMIIGCVEGRPEGRSPERLSGLYGNILPATWSLMLALRSRGVGAAWTTITFTYESEAAEILGLPEGVTPAVLLPVAYYTGTGFKPAARVPARERTYWNTWGRRRA